MGMPDSGRRATSSFEPHHGKGTDRQAVRWKANPDGRQAHGEPTGRHLDATGYRNAPSVSIRHIRVPSKSPQNGVFWGAPYGALDQQACDAVRRAMPLASLPLKKPIRLVCRPAHLDRPCPRLCPGWSAVSPDTAHSCVWRRLVRALDVSTLGIKHGAALCLPTCTSNVARTSRCSSVIRSSSSGEKPIPPWAPSRHRRVDQR